MTYINAIKKILSFPRTAGRPTLERMRLLCEYLGNPQKKLKFVHIAGTNGKGSATAMLDSVLRASGYKTGRFVSPYVLDFRERMTVDGEMITHAELCEHTEAVLDAIKHMRRDIEAARNGDAVSVYIPKVLLDGTYSDIPVQFEVVTAIGFLYFLERGCDAVLLECGLGGRYDATNIIDAPMVSMIMSIGLDHTELLGDTPEKIAEEKCGIIKSGTTEVITYPQSPSVMSVISRACMETGSRLTMPTRSDISLISASLGGLHFTYKGKEYKTKFAAIYQLMNCATVLEAAEALSRIGMNLNYDSIYRGIWATFFPARFEVLGISPTVIVDGAHNEHGISALCDSIETVSSALSGRVTFALGMLCDKEPEKALAPFVSMINKGFLNLRSIITLTPDSPRAMKADVLADLLRKMTGEKVNIQSVDSSGKTRAAEFCSLIGDLGENDAVISFGSLYLASEMRNILINYLENRI